MCGGTLEVIPCSHVGHIFRKKSPYKWRPGVDVLKINTIRLVEVWLDDYAKLYYVRRGGDKGDFGDITSRVELRKKLNCKSFKWYLENVFPELEIPDNLGEGFIKNLGVNNPQCLDVSINDRDVRNTVLSYGCHNLGSNQFFEYSRKFEIKRKTRCLTYETESKQLFFGSCYASKKESKMWTYSLDTNQFIHKESKDCLSLEHKGHQYLPTLEPCDDKNKNQKWDFQYVHKEKFATTNKTVII